MQRPLFVMLAAFGLLFVALLLASMPKSIAAHPRRRAHRRVQRDPPPLAGRAGREVAPVADVMTHLGYIVAPARCGGVLIGMVPAVMLDLARQKRRLAGLEGGKRRRSEVSRWADQQTIR